MELLAAVIPRICLIGFTFSQPFLINRIIKLVEEPETIQSINAGYGLIGATVFIYVGMGVRLPSKSSLAGFTNHSDRLQERNISTECFASSPKFAGAWSRLFSTELLICP
jgi:hypothetical protein